MRRRSRAGSDLKADGIHLGVSSQHLDDFLDLEQRYLVDYMSSESDASDDGTSSDGTIKKRIIKKLRWESPALSKLKEYLDNHSVQMMTAGYKRRCFQKYVHRTNRSISGRIPPRRTFDWAIIDNATF